MFLLAEHVRLIPLVCGHQVPLANVNKDDDDIAWCSCCKRWLVTGAWPGQKPLGRCYGRADTGKDGARGDEPLDLRGL